MAGPHSGSTELLQRRQAHPEEAQGTSSRATKEPCVAALAYPRSYEVTLLETEDGYTVFDGHTLYILYLTGTHWSVTGTHYIYYI